MQRARMQIPMIFLHENIFTFYFNFLSTFIADFNYEIDPAVNQLNVDLISCFSRYSLVIEFWSKN